MRRAFTAIELAVVLVIIAVLAIMLLPAFEESQQEAMKTKCLARVRQLGMAFEMYQSACSGYWPTTRHSVCPEHPDWSDPTSSLALLYPGYASKPYLFQCPATDDVVALEPDGRDFLNCRNFHVSPKGKPMRKEDAGKGQPHPPSYFYEGGGLPGTGIPRDALPTRVVYGDECVHGYWENQAGKGFWLGQTNHPLGGGNFLFADKHVGWLKVRWVGEPWRKGRSLPYVPNPHGAVRRARGGEQVFIVPLDTNVFWDDWGGKRREIDADLAGMMWIDDRWMEF